MSGSLSDTEKTEAHGFARKSSDLDRRCSAFTSEGWKVQNHQTLRRKGRRNTLLLLQLLLKDPVSALQSKELLIIVTLCSNCTDKIPITKRIYIYTMTRQISE